MDTDNKNLIEKLGWLELPQEQQEYLLERTGGVILQKIISRLLEEMDEGQKDAFLKLLENEEVTGEEIRDFVRSNVSNADALIKEIVDEFLTDANNIMDQI